MSIYANNSSVQAERQSRIQIDEVRYQTIGRGHGFLELEGIPFQMSEKLYYSKGLHSSLYQIDNLNLDYSRVADGGMTYTFDLEKKVLTNMANKRL